MSLPWVSREEYNVLKGIYDDAMERWTDARNDLLTERKRYDELLEKYHALKLQGAEPVPPAAQYASRPPEPDDELKALIAEHSGGDIRKRYIMLRQLKQDRADGVSPEEIRRSIESGVQAEGVPA